MSTYNMLHVVVCLNIDPLFCVLPMRFWVWLIRGEKSLFLYINIYWWQFFTVSFKQISNKGSFED